MPRALRLLAPALLVAALAASAAPARAETDSLTIGILATLEGAFAPLGQDAIRGYELAMEEHAGSVGGRRIEAVIEATDGTPDSVIAKARTLVDRGIDIIVGPLTGIESIAIREFVKSAPGATIVNGASAAQDATLRMPAENFFRFNSDSMQWIAGLGRHAYEQKGIRSIVAVAEDYSLPYTQLMGFMLEYCALGGQVLDKHWITPGANDAARLAAIVARAETDAVFLALGPRAAKSFLETYAEAGGQAAIVAGSTTLTSSLLTASGAARSLLVGATTALPVSESDDNEAWTALTRRYRERYPDAGAAPSLFALAYYVNTKAALLALDKTGGEPGDGHVRLRDALAGLRFETPFGGPVSLDENRQAVTSNFIVEVAEEADGSLSQRTIKVVPEVSQTLGLTREAFLSLGPPSRTNPHCAESTAPVAEAGPTPPEAEEQPAQPEAEEQPAQPEAEEQPAQPEAEEQPTAPEAGTSPEPPEAGEQPVSPESVSVADTPREHPLSISEEDAAMIGTAPNIVPCLRYRDAPAAIAWLKEAFGFTENMVVPGPDGTIAHAQLAFGNGLVMLGSQRDDELQMRSPCDLGGVNQSIYVIVDDADAHHARAVAAGAEIVRELEDTPYGSREYSARDPEGNLWNFGTYRPAMRE